VVEGRREVDELRQEMAKLDAQILVALDKRARAARLLREARKDHAPLLPLTDHAAIRELAARSTGDMPQDSLRDIFREIYAACLALELPVRVAYVGPEGGPTHAAACGRFGGPGVFVTEDAAAALDEVARRRAEFAVVPFETSADGPVVASVTALMASDLRIVEVLDARVALHLMNRTGNPADVERVYVTASDHALCQRFLTETDPRPVIVDVKMPLLACQLAAEDAKAAAIAHEAFGTRLGLETARRDVLDAEGQRVRYAVAGARPSSRTGDDVTSLAFSVQDAPGSLLDVLKIFAERGINLSNIQSHPVDGQAWQYLFYVDLAGHFTDRPLVMAFEEMKRITRFFRVLGSYPAP
jgi:chorismate mutase/prephenate dehydratase